MHGAPRAGHSRSNLNSLHVLDLSWWISCYHTISLLIICSKKPTGIAHNAAPFGWHSQCQMRKMGHWCWEDTNSPSCLLEIEICVLIIVPLFFQVLPSDFGSFLMCMCPLKKKKRAAAQVATVSINLFAPASALLTSLLGCLCHDVGWLTVETLISGEHGWTWEFDQLLPCFIAEQHQNLPVSNHGVWPGG